MTCLGHLLSIKSSRADRWGRSTSATPQYDLHQISCKAPSLLNCSPPVACCSRTHSKESMHWTDLSSQARFARLRNRKSSRPVRRIHQCPRRTLHPCLVGQGVRLSELVSDENFEIEGGLTPIRLPSGHERQNAKDERHELAKSPFKLLVFHILTFHDGMS